MNREELIKLLQSWLTTATDDNGNPIHVIMDVDIHEIATEIIKSSIPPAEGAEEILRRVINETIGDPGPGEFHWHIHQEIALKAMEKYANESIKFYYEGLMSDFNILLKDFYLWVDKNYALGMLTDKYDDVIKEYLEDKGKGKTLKSTHN